MVTFIAGVKAVLLTIKAIIVWVMALNTNTAIVNFVTNNLILLGIISLFVKITPWKWDNFIGNWIRSVIDLVKPDERDEVSDEEN